MRSALGEPCQGAIEQIGDQAAASPTPVVGRHLDAATEARQFALAQDVPGAASPEKRPAGDAPAAQDASHVEQRGDPSASGNQPLLRGLEFKPAPVRAEKIERRSWRKTGEIAGGRPDDLEEQRQDAGAPDTPEVVHAQGAAPERVGPFAGADHDELSGERLCHAGRPFKFE